MSVVNNVELVTTPGQEQWEISSAACQRPAASTPLALTPSAVTPLLDALAHNDVLSTTRLSDESPDHVGKVVWDAHGIVTLDGAY